MTTLGCSARYREAADGVKVVRVSLGASAILAFFASCIWYDFLKFFAGIEFNRDAVFAFAMVAAAVCAALHGWDEIRARLGSVGILIPVYFALAIGVHLLLGVPAVGKNFAMPVAPIAASLFLFVGRRVMLYPIVGTVICSALIQAQEFYSFSYWYIWQDEHIAHNTEIYMASQGLFRAKGLFAGPLNGYDFGLLALLFSEFSPLIIAFVGFGAVFAATKSGIAASTLAIMLRGYAPKQRIASLAIAAGIAATFLGTAQLIRSHTGTVLITTMQPDAKAVNIDAGIATPEAPRKLQATKQDLGAYIGNAIDPSATSTMDRFSSWLKCLEDFASFSALHIIIGDPNYSYRVPSYLDGGVESSIGKELQDLGIVGFLIALAVKAAVFLRLWRSSSKMAIGFAGYCAIALVSPIYTPFGFCMLFWLFMLQTMQHYSLTTCDKQLF